MLEMLRPVDNEEERDAIVAMLDQCKADDLFLNQRRAEWLKAYPDHWVVVYDGKLVGCSKVLEDALADAEAKGAPRAQVALKFLSIEPYGYIL